MTVDLETLGLRRQRDGARRRSTHASGDLDDDDAATPGEETAPSAGTDFLIRSRSSPPPVYDACHAAGALRLGPRHAWDPAHRDADGQPASRTTTQAFYLVYHFHDHLASAPIGFTDARRLRGDGPAATTRARSRPRRRQHGRHGGPDGDSPQQRQHDDAARRPGPLMQMYLFRVQPGAPSTSAT